MGSVFDVFDFILLKQASLEEPLLAGLKIVGITVVVEKYRRERVGLRVQHPCMTQYGHVGTDTVLACIFTPAVDKLVTAGNLKEFHLEI